MHRYRWGARPLRKMVRTCCRKGLLRRTGGRFGDEDVFAITEKGRAELEAMKQEKQVRDDR